MKKRFSHNPCFSRNVFAIITKDFDVISISCHNPCFSRNVFAMKKTEV